MLKNIILQLLKLFYPLVKKWMPFQLFAYLSVGAANTLLNIGLFALLFTLMKSFPLAVETSTAISFGITVLTGFWLTKNFAFTQAGNEKKEVQKQFSKYALVALQGQLSAYLLTKGMIVLLYMNATLAYVITAIIMLTVNYFLQKYFTFRTKKVSIN